MNGFLATASPWIRLTITRTIELLLVLLVAWALIRLGNASISRLLERRHGHPAYVDEKRAKTLASLLRSVFRYLIDFVALLTILGLFDVPVASVLALSGFIGLAVGFGAQDLVKDIIAGFFILFEDEFTVGEVIETAGLTGTVLEIGLRTTRIKDFGGQIHTLPNGMIDKVTNLNRSDMRAQVEVPVAYGVSNEDALRALSEAADEVRQADLDIKDGPRVLGISGFGPTGATYLIQAETNANSQWRVERALRAAIRKAFAGNGIEMGLSLVTNPQAQSDHKSQHKG
ncbi:MAG: mechanosensitive ion channel family protein [Bacillota bacterium]